MNSFEVKCPYCGLLTEVIVPEDGREQAEKNSCNHCHKPFTVYSSETHLRQHEDRSVKAVCVDTKDYLDEGYYLEFLENDHAHPQNIKIPLGISILGRYNKDSSADLQVYTGDIDMGRQHAKIQLKDNGRCYISDNDSKNGVFVNGTKLKKKELLLLANGDVITLGSTTAITHLPEEEEEFEEFLGD